MKFFDLKDFMDSNESVDLLCSLILLIVELNDFNTILSPIRPIETFIYNVCRFQDLNKIRIKNWRLYVLQASLKIVFSSTEIFHENYWFCSRVVVLWPENQMVP